MTMPHLMNCDHSDDGWCLDCVKALHDEKEAIRTALDKARGQARADGVTTRLFAQWCGVSPTQLCKWTGKLPLAPPDFIETDETINEAVDDGLMAQYRHRYRSK